MKPFIVFFVFSLIVGEKLGSKIKRIFNVLADHNQRIDDLTKRLENFKTFELSMIELQSINIGLTNVQERLTRIENITSPAELDIKISSATSTWQIQLHTVIGIDHNGWQRCFAKYFFSEICPLNNKSLFFVQKTWRKSISFLHVIHI